MKNRRSAAKASGAIDLAKEIAPDIQGFLGKERPDLGKLLEKWVARLKLHDWEGIATYCRYWDLAPKTCAANHIRFRCKAFSIRILDPVDYFDMHFPHDPERDLVHELVHVHLEFFDRNVQGAVDDFREQAVESLTRALIELDRRK
jgi:hypothetical protein